ncbi:hypothetical protein P9112_007990 [Eukaryota sp. TZLM1-RC]
MSSRGLKSDQASEAKSLKGQQKKEEKCLATRRKDDDFTPLPEEECAIRPTRHVCLTPPDVTRKHTAEEKDI